jgi:hypothetical protein
MGIRASDHPSLLAAVQRQLAKEPQPPKKMWLARTNSLKIKPIVMRDPVLFKQTIETIQAMNPGLTIYLFEIDGV